MSKLKSIAIAVFVVGGTLTTHSASASGYEMWNGTAWVRNAVDIFSGPFTLRYMGIVYPCTMTVVWTLSNGGIQTTASFSGSSACTSMTVQPGVTSPPMAIPGSTSVRMTISGMVIQSPGMMLTCSGQTATELSKANPYLPDPPIASPPYNYVMFNGSLGLCTLSTPAPGLPTSKPFRAYFP